ncbi:MaoC family dehydratase N-terminal domain-containing protein [Streptomyces sp. KM273126]|uniref:FAS1-like dehydratase domain-containing protein n=1 Tax=Streptomyces sp. KM273126 TaxID=2545247 RepID=UPI00103D6616|nr:MaoC family dehydratase N-terminal domain-containing protein [Streptomyces sp. KM273126]MBA2810510.1 MaoC family dehydratase N-terminal domain-containing protein [Streptomyces sp. KM273126]
MAAELDLAEERARASIGRQERRPLGVVRAEDAAEFARASGETAPRLTDPGHSRFTVHPMYLVSLLRPAPGPGPDEVRPDGMYRDEVPGTDGLDVRLMAGGQEVRWKDEVRAGDTIDVLRALTAVERKGSGDGFLLLTVEKTYSAARGVLVEVTERFIVR